MSADYEMGSSLRIFYENPFLPLFFSGLGRCSRQFLWRAAALLVAQTWMWKINKNPDFMCPTDLKREIVWENFSSSLLIAVDEFGLRQSLLFILFVQITALLRVEIMILSSLCWFNATSWTWIYVHTIEPADQLNFSARAEQAINYVS